MIAVIVQSATSLAGINVIGQRYYPPVNLRVLNTLTLQDTIKPPYTRISEWKGKPSFS